jgi:hypothetical protein
MREGGILPEDEAGCPVGKIQFGKTRAIEFFD